MKALLITVYWYLVQVEISDNTCLYVEVVDLRCMDFVEDCGSIMARECKILVYRCLIEWLEIDGFLWYIYISNIKNLLSVRLFLSTLHIPKCTSLKMYFEKTKHSETIKAFCTYWYLVSIEE
jgi:hypothetical protein